MILHSRASESKSVASHCRNGELSGLVAVQLAEIRDRRCRINVIDGPNPTWKQLQSPRA